jgi:hypothetical protein
MSLLFLSPLIYPSPSLSWQLFRSGYRPSGEVCGDNGGQSSGLGCSQQCLLFLLRVRLAAANAGLCSQKSFVSFFSGKRWPLFSKVLYILSFTCKYTWALTCENLCQASAYMSRPGDVSSSPSTHSSGSTNWDRVTWWEAFTAAVSISGITKDGPSPFGQVLKSAARELLPLSLGPVAGLPGDVSSSSMQGVGREWEAHILKSSIYSDFI